MKKIFFLISLILSTAPLSSMCVRRHIERLAQQIHQENLLVEEELAFAQLCLETAKEAEAFALGLCLQEEDRMSDVDKALLQEMQVEVVAYAEKVQQLKNRCSGSKECLALVNSKSELDNTLLEKISLD